MKKNTTRTNKYGIPEDDLKKIRERDKECVYCHKAMKEYPHTRGCPKDKATIEHFNYLPPWNNPATVAICCGSCNSSRGDNKLMDWFKKAYCIDKGINEKTVAQPVKEFISKRDIY